jgi:hypothetical protein
MGDTKKYDTINSLEDPKNMKRLGLDSFYESWLKNSLKEFKFPQKAIYFQTIAWRVDYLNVLL